MSAALIAVVVCLLLGHVFPALPSLRRYDWFIGWLHWLGRQTGGGDWPNRIGLLIAVGLPLALVGAIQFGLHDRWYSLPAFVFALLVVLYTWGPRDLDLDVEAVIEARDPEARRAAAAALFPEGGEPVEPVVDDELEAARWFTRAELDAAVAAGEMQLSPRLSIARTLIDEWIASRPHDRA